MTVHLVTPLTGEGSLSVWCLAVYVAHRQSWGCSLVTPEPRALFSWSRVWSPHSDVQLEEMSGKRWGPGRDAPAKDVAQSMGADSSGSAH